MKLSTYVRLIEDEVGALLGLDGDRLLYGLDDARANARGILALSKAAASGAAADVSGSR